MISFRFHVVSITAVFLAIAIGVVVGSTYVDSSVVPGLRNRIETVEDRAATARDENSRLEGELGDARDFIALSAEYAVTDRLPDVPIAVFATRGVDEGAAERTVVLARTAGAVVPGIVWLEPRWALEGDEDSEALATVVDGSASDDRNELWSDAWAAIAAELAPETEGTTPTGEPASDVLAQLEAEGFLTVDPLDDATVSLTDLAGSGASVLVVTATEADPSIQPMMPSVVAAMAPGLPTVAGDEFAEIPDGPARGEELQEALSEELRDTISIVDDLDREEGRVAAVLALAEAGEGQVGFHYGYGDGADAVLPAWTSP
jgi:hypothetical protein